MAGQDHHRLGGVAGAAGLEQAAVFVLRCALVAEIAQNQAHVAVDVVVQALDGGQQQRPPGGGVKGGVEAVVERAEAAGVVFRFRLVEDGGGGIEGRCVGHGRHLAHGQALQGQPHLADLRHLVPGQLADHGAAVGAVPHQALGLKLAQGLAQGNAADAQFGGQLGLPERPPGDQAIAGDGLPEDSGNEVRRRLHGAQPGWQEIFQHHGIVYCIQF